MAANKSPEPEFFMRGHKTDVTACSFARATAITAWQDPKTGAPHVLSGSADGEVRVWSLFSHQPIVTGAAHSGASVLTVEALIGGRLLTQGRDGFVRVWDCRGDSTLDKPLLELPSESYNFCQAAASDALAGSNMFDGDGDATTAAPATSGGAPLLAMANADAQRLHVWDLRQPPKSPPALILAPSESAGKAGMCMCCRFCRDDAVLLSGWEDGSLQVFDLRGGTTAGGGGGGENANNAAAPPLSRRLHKEPLLCVTTDPKGAHALSGSADCSLYVTPLSSGGEAAPAEPVAHLSIPVTNEASGSGGIASIAMRPDGRIFAAGGWDYRVRIWQMKKFKPLAVLQQHRGTVNAVSFSYDSKWLASASTDKIIAIWSLFPPKETEVDRNGFDGKGPMSYEGARWPKPVWDGPGRN